MIECNIDDMNNEFFDYTMKRLFDLGALDVFLTPIIMKKSRPAVKLSVLAKYEDIEKMSNIIFTETSTLGIRKYPVDREALERKNVNVTTKYGDLSIKEGYRKGELINYAPEYENIKKLAVSTGAPLKEIYNEALKEYNMENKK